ncbi:MULTISPECIES: hypothetical protein [unclassified Methylobacterium]|uniref:hypothetical protein n=1 Tax=unclassified Methylobacterium TaxID=2615210 RepID=UPI0003168585|nr:MULTISPECIES: hypothetical protein [Methylobacterium]WFT80753.1 hypothetical protein QA634_02275 [Methylobacterium nodulans]
MLAVLSHALPHRTPTAAEAEPGFLALISRIVQAVHAERLRRRDAQIGGFIQAHGGRVTDDIERQIGQYFC